MTILSNCAPLGLVFPFDHQVSFRIGLICSFALHIFIASKTADTILVKQKCGYNLDIRLWLTYLIDSLLLYYLQSSQGHSDGTKVALKS
jgi:hypothetical protein